MNHGKADLGIQHRPRARRMCQSSARARTPLPQGDPSPRLGGFV